MAIFAVVVESINKSRLAPDVFHLSEESLGMAAAAVATWGSG